MWGTEYETWTHKNDYELLTIDTFAGGERRHMEGGKTVEESKKCEFQSQFRLSRLCGLDKQLYLRGHSYFICLSFYVLDHIFLRVNWDPNNGI